MDENNSAGRVCIFDLDGTLIDSQLKIQNDIACAMKRLGVSVSEQEIRGNWYELARKYGFSEQEFDCELDKRMSWEDALNHGIVTLFPETMEILSYLSDKKVVLALLSRSNQLYTQQKMDYFNLGKFFAGINVVDFKDDSKAKGALELVRTLDIPPSSTLYCIGDRLEDIVISKDIKNHLSEFKSFGVYVNRNNNGIYVSDNYFKVNSLEEIPNIVGV